MKKTICTIISALMFLEPVMVAAQSGKTLRDSRREKAPRADAPDSERATLSSRVEMPMLPRGLDAPIDPDTYIVGPNDEFVLLIGSQSGQEVRLRVLPEGVIMLPSVGALPVAGLTITQFREAMARELGRYYRSAEFSCQLAVPRTFVVYVLGEVDIPGPVEITASFRADIAISAAGGITDRGTRRAIEIRKGGEVVGRCDLLRFLRTGDLGDNPALSEGQTILVPTRGPSCTVIGEIWRNENMEIMPGETIADVIALAGGATSAAAEGRVVVERLDSADKLQVFNVNEAAYDDTVVRDRDVIVAPNRRSLLAAGAVRVEGGGLREGRVLIAEGETVNSFLDRMLRLEDNYDLAHAVVERRDNSGRVQFIDIDLTRVVSGEDTTSVPLHPGDVISVPPRDDVVYVTGEVVLPGSVGFQRGLPASRYIALSGGPSQQGSLDRLEIFDAQGRRRSGNRDALVYRGETILVKRRTSVILGNTFVGLASLTSLILAAIAVTR